MYHHQDYGTDDELVLPKQRFQVFALRMTILVLGLWGLALIFAPDLVAPIFSNEPVNHAFAGMMGAALLGLTIITLANITRWTSPTRALGIAMLILVLETGYLMLGAGAMLVTPATAVSLVMAAAVAFFLLI